MHIHAHITSIYFFVFKNFQVQELFCFRYLTIFKIIYYITCVESDCRTRPMPRSTVFPTCVKNEFYTNDIEYFSYEHKIKKNVKSVNLAMEVKLRCSWFQICFLYSIVRVHSNTLHIIVIVYLIYSRK